MDYVRNAFAEFGLPAIAAVSAPSVDLMTDVAADNTGATQGVALPSQSGLPGSELLFSVPFGMEAQEYGAYIFEGGGDAVVQAAFANYAGTDANFGNVIAFPIRVTPGEAGGWWKEPISEKMLDEGKYISGDQLKLRLFGIGQTIMNKVFPNVDTPAATPGTPFLQDFKDGVFNAGEYGQPHLDAFSGLFPNSDYGTETVALPESIIAAGAKHYYMNSFWQPGTVIDLFLNKTWYDALSAGDKLKVKIACMYSCMSNLALELGANARIMSQFKDLGGVIHRRWPFDVLQRLSAASPEVMKENAEADGTGTYQIILDGLQAYAKENQIMWSHVETPRAERWGAGWIGWESDVTI
jgi:TRAP-type mannitol/chloroaromatic compound transport system substrate-binding protein